MLAAEADLPCRDVGRAGRALGDFRDADAEGRSLGQVHGDAQVVGRARIDVDRGHPGHRFDARPDHVLDVAAVILDRPFGAGQQLHEEPRQRVVGVVLATAELDDRPVGVGRLRADPVHAPDHVDQGRTHVGADGEGQVDEAAAGIGVALDLLDARQTLQHLFLRLEQLGLGFLGRSRSPAGEDRDVRPLDVGKQLQRQPAEAHRPEQADQP